MVGRGAESGNRRVALAIHRLAWQQVSKNGEPLSEKQAQLVARSLEALDLRGHESVLDIGTGSGYRAALLGSLARVVHSVELRPEVAESARRTLRQLAVHNVEVIEGDGSLGWPEAAPYSAILVGAAVPDVPSQLLDQLAEDGCLVIPIGDENGQLVECFRRRRLTLESRTVAPCVVAPLVCSTQRMASVPWARHS